MKTTYIELKRFTGVASAFLQSPSSETPLHYALRKLCRRAESAVRSIEEENTDRRIDLASIDDKKNVVFDARGNYQFTRENLTVLTKFLRTQDERKVEIEPHFVPAEKLPSNLPPAFVDAFTGFVINPERAAVSDAELAGDLYEIYCAAVGGFAMNGDQLPSWKEFAADPAKLKQSAAWIAIAKASRNVGGAQTNIAIEHLIGANELLRSAHSVAERNGEKTNWPAFKDCLAKILQNQHELLHGREFALNHSFEV